MRTLIALSLAAIVCADVGYNYNAGSGGTFIGGFTTTNGDGSSVGLGGPAFSSFGVSSGEGQAQSPIASNPSAEVTYAKEFYTFSAPESEFNTPENVAHHASSLKKNLRVIFIKTPESNGLANAAIQLAKHASEEKTAIYVLSKQADIGSLANKFQNTNLKSSSKPEVHFVKYRTPEDAANAEKTIQAQYDQLAGNSETHDGGVAPVLNFASPTPIVQGATPKAPDNAYLPPSAIRSLSV